METRGHARLGPSGAHRWINCPASIRVAESLEITGADTGSVYAAEGTAAHTIAEILASSRFGKITDAMMDAAFAAWRGANDEAAWLGERTIGEVLEEMIEHGTFYTDLIVDNLSPLVSDEIHLELRVDTGVKDVWGTGDCVLINPQRVTIIDYKYGEGVKVHAPSNEQLMFYALGAVEADLIGTAVEVRMVICQPRLDHVSYWDISLADLLMWRDEVAAPAAALAVTDDAPFGPGEETCRFCPARGQCNAQTAWIAQRDFGPESIDIMDGDAYAEALEILPAVRAWASAVEERALQRAYSDGEPIPGWKVVLSGGKRVIPDPDAAVARLVDAGYERSKVERTTTTIQTLGELDKVVKVGRKKVLAEVLGDLLSESPGRPSLVPEADPRPEHSATDQAAKDFAD